MAPKKRQSSYNLKEQLLKEFYNFSFFNAVHLLEKLSPQKKALGETLSPNEEALKFSVKPGLHFPPSEISNISQPDEESPPNMEVAFMGLIGPSGVLPHWYNELALERSRGIITTDGLKVKDFTLIDFFNIFHHRFISLFYLAWKKHRFPENYLPGAKDRLSRYLLSLIGLGTPLISEKIALPKEALIFYSGLLSKSAPSVDTLKACVRYFSGTAVKIEQFIERLIPLDFEDQTRIGEANTALGENTLCGSYAWECQTKFRINLGPMGYERFVSFLPTGKMLGSIFSLVKYIVGMEYEFEIRVFLKKEEIPPCKLGEDLSSTYPRLGLSAWSGIAEDDPYIIFQEADIT